MNFSHYLWHNDTYVVDTLNHGFASAWYGDSSFCWIWQHFTGNLNRGSGYFSNLLNFGAPFAYEGATLGGRHNQAKGDGGSWNGARRYEVVEILKNWILQHDFFKKQNFRIHLLEFVAYEGKCFKNGFRVSGDCDNSFRTASITYVYFRSALKKNLDLKFLKFYIIATSSRNLLTMSPFFPIMLPTS